MRNKETEGDEDSSVVMVEAQDVVQENSMATSVTSLSNPTASFTAASSSSTAKKTLKAATALVGKNVMTTFGVGIVLEYRTADQVFVIKLTSPESYAAVGTLYTHAMPTRHETDVEKAEALNVAYEALEKMRRLNLEVQCHEIGIHEQIDHTYCTTCLLANKGGSTGRNHFPRLQKVVDAAVTGDLENFPRLNRLFNAMDMAVSGEEEEDDFDDPEAPVTQELLLQQAMSSPKRNSKATVTKTPPTTSHESEEEVLDDRKPAAKEKDEGDSTEKPAKESENIEGSTTKTAAESEATKDTTTKPSPPSQADLLQEAMSSPKKKEAPVAPASGAKMHGESTTITDGASQEQLLHQAMSPKKSPKKAPAPEPTSFPRLRSLWGKIESIPQPASTQPQPSSAPSAETTQQPPEPASASFPRLRGLLDSSGASNMFSSITSTPATSGVFGSQSAPAKDPRAASEKPIALPRIQRMMDQRQKANTEACLICASPSCSAHSSASFRKEGITLCLECEKLFELDFIVDCCSADDPIERAKNIDHMVDCYDRCMLLLHYSTQFVDQIADALEGQKEMQDKVGLASSSVGVLSGVLGIAAAASILTPAGPPLLIASLFFGGGATTVQTGTEAMNYFSEPRKLADKIIALHGMSLSLLRVTSTLRDAMLRDHIRTDAYEVVPTALKEQVQEKIEKNRAAVLAGSNVGRGVALGGLAGAEIAEAGAGVAAGTAMVTAEGAAAASATSAATAGAAGARSATAFSRSATAAARTVRFARFAGGALSAAVLVMEANAIQSTLKSIHDGSPCDKAEGLRRVAQEVDDFPTSDELDGECQAYLEALANRPPPPPEVVAAAEPDHLPAEADIPVVNCQAVAGDYQMCAPGATILGGEPTGNAGATSDVAGASSFLGGSSLVQRFQERQELRQHMSMSQAEEVVAVAVEDPRLEESGINLVV